MAQLTLTVDENVLAQYQEIAAVRRISVNAMLRSHMEEATDIAERRREARVWMAAKAQENMANDDPIPDEQGWRWNREDCYSGTRFDRLRKI